MKLFHRIIQSNPSPTRHAILVHGIMGSSRNLMTFARMLTERFPKWQVWLTDLRHHGESGYFPPPNTIDSCAQDVLTWIKNLDISVDMLIGHSYGGKVVLRLNELMPVKQVWVWDAEPGFKDPNKTDDMIKQLKAIPMPKKNRQEVLQAMLDLGLTRETALWMMMNVVVLFGIKHVIVCTLYFFSNMFACIFKSDLIQINFCIILFSISIVEQGP
ncbi:MAG: alpha/beta fold hydrolase [Deltaproteobacteria bacterium]|nr:alpha/beta fold hydrolase [Deltaproteobacteria bacterium]